MKVAHAAAGTCAKENHVHGCSEQAVETANSRWRMRHCHTRRERRKVDRDLASVARASVGEYGNASVRGSPSQIHLGCGVHRKHRCLGARLDREIREDEPFVECEGVHTTPMELE